MSNQGFVAIRALEKGVFVEELRLSLRVRVGHSDVRICAKVPLVIVSGLISPTLLVSWAIMDLTKS